MDTRLIIIFFLLPLLLQSSISSPTSKTPPSNRPVFLVVSFDGFRRSYLNPTDTPVLTNLSLTGSTVPYMIPAFPTRTFPNHQSIATGLYTDSHGIVDNVFYDPLYNATLDGRSNDSRFWNYDPNVLPIWIHNEREGGVSGCLMWPGSSMPYGNQSDLLPTYYYNGYNQEVSWESRVETVIGWMTDKVKPANLVFLYFHEPDSAGHAYGPNGQETLTQVRETDKRVGYLIDKLRVAGMYDKVNLVILSDHGMAEVTSNRSIDLGQFVDREKLVGNVHGYSPVMQLVPKKGEGEQLWGVLERESGRLNLSVFRKEGICEEPYFYCRSRRIHDFVTVADPGWSLQKLRTKSSRKKSGGGKSVYGTHGYVNTAESMRVFMIAKGPAFKQGFVTPAPIKNVDIVPLISKVLGIGDVPSNGSLSRIEGIIAG